MPDPETRKERRERQHRELEESQRQLRDSIAKTQRLLNESDEIIRRHRRESEGDEDA